MSSNLRDIKLSPALQYKLKSMPRGHDYSKQITHMCDIPETTISIDSNSDCFLCSCEGWLPIPVGNVEDFHSIDEVFSSDTAKILKSDISNQKFSWCAVEHCGILSNNHPLMPYYMLNINIDNSCNLSCPSCRREQIMTSSGPDFDRRIEHVERIMHWLSNFNKPIVISLGGSGDPLASAVLRPLILNYVPAPTQKFSIGTNGLLLKKVISQSTIADSIIGYEISVDAGTPEVYHQVRRPGRWKDLLDNLEWLKQNVKKGQRVNLSFIIQKSNYKDIGKFSELCNSLGFTGHLQHLVDWGTWNSIAVDNPDPYTIANGTFQDHDVASPAHPEHHEFVQILNNFIKTEQKHVTIASYFNKFINQ